MSSIFNRRAALGVLGASTGAFVLAACDANRSVSKGSSSSSSEPSETSPSASSATAQTDIDMSGDYKGKINFESVLEYKKSGTYEPATEEHAARNVPQPKKPEDANDKSLKGLYLSVAFAAAATQYAYNTGDYSLAEESALSESERDNYKGLEKVRLKKIREGNYWPDNVTIEYEITEPQPLLEDDRYLWSRTFKITYGKFEVEDGRVIYPKSGKGSVVAEEFIGLVSAQYVNGAWEISSHDNRRKE